MFRLIGHPTHSGEGFFPTKAFLVLAFVVLSPERRISRERVASLIWGGTSRKRAFSNLRYVLSNVRKWECRNGTKLLDVSPKFLARTDQHAPCDVELIYNIDGSQPEKTLELIADLFRGELLEGFDFSDDLSQEFLLSERHRIRNHAFLIALQASAKTTGDKVSLALDRLARLAPNDEAILRARITNMCLTGQRDAAKNLFTSFQTQLRREFECDVELETRELASRMLPSTIAPPRAVLPEPAQVGQIAKSKSKTLPRLLLLPPLPEPFIPPSPKIAILAKGLVAEVNLLLGRMRTFAIIAPHSANQLTKLEALDAAQRVEADYVVSSRVYSHQLDSRRAKLGITLLHSSTHEVLVSEIVEMDIRNLSNLHFEIANSVSSAIAAKIMSSELARFESSGITSAYLYFLLGRQHLGYDLKDLRAAKRNFGRAVKLSPTFSSARAMLARTQTNEWLILQRSDTDLLLQSTANARKAIELDPMDPLGYRELGHAKLYSGALEEASSYLEKALAYAPNVADLLADQADVYIHKGDGGKAIKILDKAMALNPLPPDSYIWTKATAQFLNEEYDTALRTFGQMKNTDPVERLMAACAAMLGEHEMASSYRRRWLQNYPDSQVSAWSTIMPMAKPEIAGQIIDAMRRAGFC